MEISAFFVPRSCCALKRAFRVEILGLDGPNMKRLEVPSSLLVPSCRSSRTPEFLRTR